MMLVKLSPSVGVSLALFLFFAAATVEGATAQEVAATSAAELKKGITGAGLADQAVLLSPFRIPDDATEQVKEFPSLLTKALVSEQGLQLIDPQALERAMQETQLGALSDASTLKEVGGGLGAKVMITGTIDQVPGGHRVNLKAVFIEDGKLLATAGGTIAATAATKAGTPMGLQAELRRLADLLAAGLDQIDGEARYQTFAVLPFQEVGAAAQENQLGLLVAAELTTFLQRDHWLMMVERGQIAKVIEEMALGQTGLVAEDKAVQIGKLAGAEALIMGTVSAAGDRYLVNAKVVQSATAKVIVVEKAELPAADLIALSADAVVLRSTFGAVYRSALLPGWGQFYNREAVKGGIFLGAEAAALGLTLTFFMLSEERLGYYRSLGAGTPADEFRNALSQARTYRDLILFTALATVGVHLINVVDAYLNSKSYDSATAGVSASAGLTSW